jgi:hypothetical protein
MGGGCGLNASGLAKGLVGGPSEHSNELLGSIKGGEFLD